MNMKKIYRTLDALILLVAVAYVGYAGVCIFVLLIFYHDMPSVLCYSYKAMIAFILYATWAHKWFFLHFTKKPNIHFPKQPVVAKPSKMYSVTHIQYCAIALYALIVVLTCVFFYRSFSFSSFLWNTICLLVFTLLCIAAIGICYHRKDAFSEAFMGLTIENERNDAISKMLYQKIVGCRSPFVCATVGFAIFACIFLLLFVHYRRCNIWYLLVSIVFFLYSILYNHVLFTYESCLYIEEAGKKGYALSILGVFKQIYASRRSLLGSNKVEYLMVVKTLYQQGLYADALQLLLLLSAKKRQRAYAYYCSVLTFLCQWHLHNEEAAQHSMTQMDVIWQHAKRHDRMLWRMGKELYTHEMDVKNKNDGIQNESMEA